jgi:hypothetical protein
MSRRLGINRIGVHAVVHQCQDQLVKLRYISTFPVAAPPNSNPLFILAFRFIIRRRQREITVEEVEEWHHNCWQLGKRLRLLPALCHGQSTSLPAVKPPSCAVVFKRRTNVFTTTA